MAQGYPSLSLCFNKKKAKKKKKSTIKKNTLKITSRKRKKFSQEKSPDKTTSLSVEAGETVAFISGGLLWSSIQGQ